MCVRRHFIRSILLLAAMLAATSLPSLASSGAFTVGAPLVSQSVFSCGDLTMSDGVIDSSGVANATPTNRAVIRSNGNVRISGGTVNGDAVAGPGKAVQLSGSARVTGTTSIAAAALGCTPIDLTSLASTLQTTNDNARIPLTTQGKNPLGGTSHTDFTLSGGDSVTLAAGTYYFTKISLSGGASIKVSGVVHIFSVGRVDLTGGSFMNANGSPFNLRLWVSSSPFNLSSSTLSAIVYAPAAAATVSAGHLVGGLFANSVTISGGSHVTEVLDDVAPSVTISAPPDSSVATTPSIVVRGAATDDQTAVSASVNGIPVVIAADGTFQATVSLAGLSPAAITAVATDAAGNTASAKITIVTLPPTLASIAPNKGPTAGGTTVAMTGANFTDSSDTTAKIGGLTVTQLAVPSPTSVTANTPAAPGGPANVIVSTFAGSATLAGGFTYFASPVITSIAPSSGGAGASVTVTGQNFDPDKTGDQLTLGTTPVTIASATATQILFVVPAGATTGKLTVTTAGGSVTPTSDFVVPVLTAIAVAPSSATAVEGKTQAFTATGSYSDGSTKDLTATVWSTSDTTLATIDANGVATAIKAGSVTVTATMGTIHGSATLTIQPKLAGLAVAPQNATVRQRATQSFTATATYSDGSTADATAIAVWTTSASSIATVISGSVTAVAPGQATITATLGAFAGSANVTVTPVPTSLAVTPSSLTLNQGSTATLTATVTFSDNTTKDETATATWTTSSAAIATVNAGSVMGVTPGTVTIGAAAEGFTASAAVKVAAVLQSIHLNAAISSLTKGQTTQLTATGSYSDGSTTDLTATAVWTSSVPTVATVASGLVTAVGPGTSTITAAVGSMTTACNVTVVAPGPTITTITIAPSMVSLSVGDTLQLSANATYSDGSTGDVTASASWTSTNNSIATVSASGLLTATGSGNASVTASVSSKTATVSVQVVPAVPLPPDPSVVAPPPRLTEVTSFANSTSFLYTGPNPIQTGVRPGAIDPLQAGVIRGRMLTRDGRPLSAVHVSIASHPEWGETLSRADGAFDLAVNGGTTFHLHFVKSGYIESDRQAAVPWQDFTLVPDVALVPFDGQATAITSSAAAIQVARGSQASDSDGTRTATILFPAGTSASMQLPDGSSQALPTLTVRATEFTVGASGPNAMPATLPPESGYTYCVELSADEAQQAGGTTVAFSKPVAFYVENFLGFPVGSTVPSGYFDRVQRKWIAMDNGVVVKVLSVANGSATIDSSGNGVADDATRLAALGVDADELAQIASLYTVGQTLWRVRLSHFTPIDHNWPIGPPRGAVPPRNRRPRTAHTTVTPVRCPGSSIDCHNQVLGESLGLAGTPAELHYNSRNQRGRRDSYKLDIALSGDTVPPEMTSINLDVWIAGTWFHQEFSPTPNRDYVYVWNGLDAYNRVVQGTRIARVKISYTYQAARYLTAGEVLQAFAEYSTAGVAVTTDRARQSVDLSQEFEVTLGSWDAAAAIGLGGWTISPIHTYDPYRQILHLGTGVDLNAEAIGSVVTTVAGNGQCCSFQDGIAATSAQLDYPTSVKAAPDGGYYITEAEKVFHVLRDGSIVTVAGNGQAGYSGDGGPATQAQINAWDSVPAPDGSIYINDFTRIRKVTPDGLIATVAGNGQRGNFIEGPALQTSIFAEGIAIDQDGTLYLASDSMVQKLTPDGRLVIVAGQPSPQGTFVDNVPAKQAVFHGILSMAVGPDDSLYLADDDRIQSIYRVTPDGILHLFAGSRDTSLPDRDGVPATSVAISSGNNTGAQIWGIAVGPDGTVYWSDLGGQRIRAVLPDGIITTVAGGSGKDIWPLPAGEQPALGAVISFPWDVDVAPDGSLLIIAYDGDAVQRMKPSLPSLGAAQMLIGSQGGGAAYVFDTNGRHLRTVDTNTGVDVAEFTYDNLGNFTSMKDVDGNVLSVERDATGTATAIVAPGGQRTELTLGTDGFLTSVKDPGGEITGLSYNAGLLTTFTTPRQGTHRFTYDADGLLIKDEDPAGGFTTLTGTATATGLSVTRSTAEGRTTVLTIDESNPLAPVRTATGSDGLTATSVVALSHVMSTTTSDGVNVSGAEAADARFGLQSPFTASATITLPSGRKASLQRTRSLVLSNPSDPLSPTSRTETTTLNGKTFTMSFDAGSRTRMTTTPIGRSIVRSFDLKGHVQQISVPGLDPVTFGYDARGRLTTRSQSSRTNTLGYDDANRLTSVTDSLGRTAGYGYDTDGRVTQKTLFDGRQITFTYDANSNLTSVTPPGRPAHLFTANAVDRPDSYTPPIVPNGGSPTRLRYNLDHQITSVTRADGSQVSFAYDSAGRRSSIIAGSGTFQFTYDKGTGQAASILAPSGVTNAFAFDGPLPTSVSWSGPVSGSIHYDYDSDLRVASRTVSGGPALTFGYDGDGLLNAVGPESIARDAANGRITGTAAGNVQDTYAFSSFGEMSDYSVNANGMPIFKQHYDRDAAGRIITIIETTVSGTATRTYGYDTSGRLQSVALGGLPYATYSYDANSNRTAHTLPGGTESGTYDDQDRVTSYAGYTFSYTPNGEIAAKTSVQGTTSFAYDSFGNLVGSTLADGTTIEYLLDGRNRRVVRKVAGAVVQKYLYADGLRPVALLGADDSVVAEFVYGERPNVPSLMIRGGSTYRIVADHLGSPRAVVDIASGAVMETLSYDEFGNVTFDSNPGFQPFGFGGGLYEPETKLVHFGAREYDPSLGRFLSKDPIGFAGGQANVYDYAANDPVNLADPTGLLFGGSVNAGEDYGQGAVDQYADWYTDPNASFLQRVGSAIGGGFAALWTPCTSDRTFQTLLSAAVGELGPAPAPASGLGDLTSAEAEAIQDVVNQAGRPLEVVGSVARGARTVASDIDYVVPPSSLEHFQGLEDQLPGLDPSHGIIPGVGNPNIGPVIRFEPELLP